MAHLRYFTRFTTQMAPSTQPVHTHPLLGQPGGLQSIFCLKRRRTTPGPPPELCAITHRFGKKIAHSCRFACLTTQMAISTQPVHTYPLLSQRGSLRSIFDPKQCRVPIPPWNHGYSTPIRPENGPFMPFRLFYHPNGPIDPFGPHSPAPQPAGGHPIDFCPKTMPILGTWAPPTVGYRTSIRIKNDPFATFRPFGHPNGPADPTSPHSPAPQPAEGPQVNFQLKMTPDL